MAAAGLFALFLAPELSAAEAQNSAAVVTVHSKVEAPNPVPFGFNVNSNVQYDITDNHWIQDGGFAPLQNRLSFMAESGTANSFVDVSTHGGDNDFDSIATGFFNGATAYTYRYSKGAWSLLRTDVVAKFTAAASSDTNPVDHTVTFVSNGPPLQAGDVIWLNQDNFTKIDPSTIAPRLLPGGANDGWGVVGSVDASPNGTTLTFRRIPDGPPGDNVGNPSQSLPECRSISSTISQQVSMEQYTQATVGPTSDYFEAGHSYTVSVWLKQSGLANNSVTFKLLPLSISNTFTGVTNTWQLFTYTFSNVPPSGGTTWAFQFQGPGTLEIDNVEVYDSSHPPDTLDPRALAAWQNYKPGTMRIWNAFTDYLFWSLDSCLTSELKGRNSIDIGWTGAVPICPEHLPAALYNCKLIGADPWIIANMSWTQQEWSNLIDYLAGSSSTPYGAMRPSTHPNPYTDDFKNIYIEFGNEEWGTQWTTPNVHYGAYAHLMLGCARANPHFNPKIKFILNGFTNNENDFGPGAIAVAPEGSLVDYFSYSGGNASLTGNAYYQSELVALPAQYQGTINGWVAAEQQSSAAGHPYTIATYEGGPGTDDPNGGKGAGDDSLAAAVASLDIFLYGSQSGLGPQNFFLYNLGTNPYTSHTNFENGFRPHPIWEALQMRNQYCRGPMTTAEINVAPATTDTHKYPLLSSYAFHDSAGNADVWVLSRDVSNSTPVTIHLPATPTGSATLYTLTGGAKGAGANNDTKMDVPIATQSISGMGRDYSFTMPPSSAYLFVVPTGAWPTAGPADLSGASAVNGVFLNWTAYPGAITYNVYRGTSAGQEGYTPYLTGLTIPAHLDTSAPGGTPLYYRITAVTSAGETDFSNEVSGTKGPDISDGTFAVPSLGAQTSEYNPKGNSWTFSGDSGIQSNGSAWSAPAAPDGTQTAFIQEAKGSNGTISQSINFPVTGTYVMTLQAAAWTAGGQSINVVMDGNTIGTFTPTATTGFTSFTTGSFTITTLGNHTLALAGTAASGDVCDFIGSVGIVPVMVENGNFETPTVGAGVQKYKPAGSFWTFTGYGGIQSNGSPWSAPLAPDGKQTAFLQGHDGTGSSMSQKINFTKPGTYAVSLQAAAWASGNGGQPINVTLDGTVIGTLTPTSKSFTSFTSSFPIKIPGNHELAFVGTVTSGNVCDFIDSVSVNPSP